MNLNPPVIEIEYLLGKTVTRPHAVAKVDAVLVINGVTYVDLSDAFSNKDRVTYAEFQTLWKVTK